MFRSSKFVSISLTALMIAALSACNLGQPAQPTTPTVDLTAIGTTIAATVQAEMTLNAPTAAPTLTITPSATSTTDAAGATNTQGIPVEETSVLTPTGTALIVGGNTSTPSLTPIGGATAIPSFTPVLVVGNTQVVGPVCKNAAFDGDVTIPDGTEMKAWEKFEKVWAVKNTGTCRWDEGFFFAATDGPPSMGKNQGRHGFKTSDRFVEPGATTYISIDMYAPGDPGEYVAHWHMFDDSGQPFGGDFTVVIKVVP